MAKFPDKFKILPTADFHVHLRDGPMTELVTPMIEQGGADTVMVMPNLTPPITTVSAALDYKSRLQPLSPRTTFLMTLYLHPSITPATVSEAAAARITGIKMYPAGVTTNSASGVVDLKAYYPVFEAMQTHGLVLNLHGEVPSTNPCSYVPTSSTERPEKQEETINIRNAEPAFLPALVDLHKHFPKLRIVLEHVTTSAAVNVVLSCGPNVAATITAHHLWLTMDDWAGDVFGYCKPIAKRLEDRIALCRAVVGEFGNRSEPADQDESCSKMDDESSRKFFFGSDSAPHALSSKLSATGKAAAGCFTQPYTTQLVIGAMEEAVHNGWVRPEGVSQEVMEAFLRTRGRRFYGLSEESHEKGRKVVVKREKEILNERMKTKHGTVEVVPFRAGKETWSLKWI